jgi:hypothetical protein
MTGRNLTRLLLLMAVLALRCATYGQGGATGAIGGVVENGTGGPISNAQIEISAADRGGAVLTVFTNASSNFTVSFTSGGGSRHAVFCRYVQHVEPSRV